MNWDGIVRRLGWEVAFVPAIGFLGGAFVDTFFGSKLGFLLLPTMLVVWFRGVSVVNRTWELDLRAAEERGRSLALRHLQIDPGQVECFTIRTALAGKRLAVVPFTNYKAAYVFLGDTFISIQEGFEVDLRRRQELSARLTNQEIYLKNVSGADYRRPNVVVRTLNGGSVTWLAEEGIGNENVMAIRRRLRSGAATLGQTLGASVVVSNSFFGSAVNGR